MTKLFFTARKLSSAFFLIMFLLEGRPIGIIIIILIYKMQDLMAEQVRKKI